MTYSALLEEESRQANFLVVIKPRRICSTWNILSGSVYYTEFDFTEYVESVEQDGVSLVANTSTTLAAGEFFFDQTAKRLYVRTSDSVDPTPKFMVATYELYWGTFDAHWFRIPTDDSSLPVYFDPVIVQAPSIKSTASDLVYGFLPVQSTQITVSNAEHELEKHIYDSSFHQIDCEVYHWLGEDLETANIKKVLSGLCKELTYSQSSIQITILDRVDEFTREWRNIDSSYYNTTDFPSLNPNFDGKPIRYVYGRVEGFVPVNVSYVDDEPTTGDNRSWAVIAEQTGVSNITRTVPASPSSTTTRTYVNSAEGLYVGDGVMIDGSTDYFVKINNVSYSPTPYFEHEAIGAPAGTGDIVRRPFVSLITIIQDGVLYEAIYGRDYLEDILMAGGVSGFTFETSLETNLSMPRTLSTSDQVFCTVYGRRNDVTIGGPAFGGNHPEFGTLTAPFIILFDILKQRVGITEAEINLTSFTAANTASGSEAIGFAIPKTSQNPFPKFKDLVIDILKTTISKIFLDNDLKWEVLKTGLIGASDQTIESEEILDKSVSYAFKFDDIASEVTVEYALKETDETQQETKKTKTVSSSQAKFLHKQDQTKTIQSLHIKEEDAEELAEKMSTIYGDRLGQFVIKTKDKSFGVLLGDVITIQREKLPGFSYVPGTVRTRDFVVNEVTKSLRDVSITLNDQKGIEENSSIWS